MKYLWVLLLSLFVAGCAVTTPNVPVTAYYQYHKNPPVKNHLAYRIYPIYLDKSFSKEEVATFQKVIAEWNNVLNGYFTIVLVATFDSADKRQVQYVESKIQKTYEGMIVFGISEENALIKKEVFDAEGNPDGKLAFVNGLGDNGHIMVVIRDRIDFKNLHKILLHEFGHAMGADHTQALSLMYPGYGGNEPDCVDKMTAAQVANYHGLDLSRMNYCSTPNFE